MFDSQSFNVFLGLVGYEFQKDRFCQYRSGVIDSTLLEAKRSCDQDIHCAGIDNRKCDGKEYHTCRGHPAAITFSNEGSCAWMKERGGKRTLDTNKGA